MGRHQLAREYSSRAFDALLDRIESASLRWEAGEAQPGPGWPYDDPKDSEQAESQFMKGSWYAADAEEDRPARRDRRGR